jgi:hypothetical protein
MTDSARTSRTSQLVWLCVFLSAAAITAVSSHSFWIDEFATTHFASQGSLAECWAELVRMRFPELQAPLYMAYIWSWVQVFGTGEWTMRMAGAPWFVGGAVVYSLIVGRALRAISTVAVVTAFSSFAWFYLNEARVYSFQLGFALAVVAAAFELVRTANQTVSRRIVRLFAFALVGLCGSNVLGAMAAFFLFLAMLALIPPSRWIPVIKIAPLACATAALLLLGIAAYYVWTLSVGPRPTAVSTTTFYSVAFALYEIFGATGLGPSRHVLREQGVAALRPYLVSFLPFVLLSAWIVVQGFGHAWKNAGRRRLVFAVAAALLPICLLVAVGVSTRFRMVGRHVAAIAPLALLLVTTGVVAAMRQGVRSRLLAAVFLFFWTASALLVRFAPWHHKDDYRGAMDVTRGVLRSGGVVWWTADPGGVTYYRDKFSNPSPRSRLVPLMNATQSAVAALPPPSLIVMSKPDTYDALGSVSAYLRNHNFKRVAELPAFVFWAPPSSGW